MHNPNCIVCGTVSLREYFTCVFANKVNRSVCAHEFMNVCVCGFRGCADACRPCVCCLALRDVLGADEPLQFWQFVRVTNTQPGMTSSPSGWGQRTDGFYSVDPLVNMLVKY